MKFPAPDFSHLVEDSAKIHALGADLREGMAPSVLAADDRHREFFVRMQKHHRAVSAHYKFHAENPHFLSNLSRPAKFSARPLEPVKDGDLEKNRLPGFIVGPADYTIDIAPTGDASVVFPVSKTQRQLAEFFGMPVPPPNYNYAAGFSNDESGFFGEREFRSAAHKKWPGVQTFINAQTAFTNEFDERIHQYDDPGASIGILCYAELRLRNAAHNVEKMFDNLTPEQREFVPLNCLWGEPVDFKYVAAVMEFAQSRAQREGMPLEDWWNKQHSAGKEKWYSLPSLFSQRADEISLDIAEILGQTPQQHLEHCQIEHRKNLQKFIDDPRHDDGLFR